MEPVDGWPLWKQFYHLLYWLGHWLVGPEVFREPSLSWPC